MALRALLLSSILLATACAPTPTPARCPEVPAPPPTSSAPPVRVGPASPARAEVTVSAGDFAVTVRATRSATWPTSSTASPT